MKKKLQLLIIYALSYNPVTKSIEEEPLKIENNVPENSQQQEAVQEIERHKQALQKLLEANERAKESYSNALSNFHSGDDLDDFNPKGTMKRKEKEINAYSRKIAEIHNTVVLDPAKHISPNDVKKGKVSHDTIKENVANAGEAIKASNKLSDEFMSKSHDQANAKTDKKSTDNKSEQNLQDEEKETVEKLPTVEKTVFEKLFDTFLDFFNRGDIAQAKNAFRNAKNKKEIADALKSLSEDQRIDVINHIMADAPKNHLSHPTPTKAMTDFVEGMNSILPANEQIKITIKDNNIRVVKA